MVVTRNAKTIDPIVAARYLLLAELVALLFSTSAAEFFEALVYLAFLSSPALRRRFWNTLQHPAAIALGAFAIVVAIATLYGAAPWTDRLGALIGWRRLLLFIFTFSVFDDEHSKILALRVFLVTCIAAALLSFATLLVDIQIKNLGHGIVLHNHATQGMMFAVSAAIVGISLIGQPGWTGDWLLGKYYLMITALGILIANITFVTPGRSGYLVLLIMIAVLIFSISSGSIRRRTAICAGVLLCTCAVLATSSTVRSRIGQGLKEIENSAQSTAMTSMGIRVIMWRNAVHIISDHALFGVGTGSFESAYEKQVSDQAGWQGTPTPDPHNQFLKIWAEQGLPGLAALFAFIGITLTSPGMAPFRQLAIAVLLAWCASSLFSSHFSTFVEGRFLFIWLGTMLGQPLSSMIRAPLGHNDCAK